MVCVFYAGKGNAVDDCVNASIFRPTDCEQFEDARLEKFGNFTLDLTIHLTQNTTYLPTGSVIIVLFLQVIPHSCETLH